MDVTCQPHLHSPEQKAPVSFYFSEVSQTDPTWYNVPLSSVQCSPTDPEVFKWFSVSFMAALTLDI